MGGRAVGGRAGGRAARRDHVRPEGGARRGGQGAAGGVEARPARAQGAHGARALRDAARAAVLCDAARARVLAARRARKRDHGEHCLARLKYNVWRS